MKKIILSENKFVGLLTEMMFEYNSYDGNADNNPYAKKIKMAKDSLEKLLSTSGQVMINIENGKEYLTYELFSLADAIGKRYCLCQLLKDNEQYGSISTKPMELFKVKITKNYI